CAVVNGGLQCWGNNSHGELGNNSKIDSPTPTQVVGLASGVTAIAAGGLHTCAVSNATLVNGDIVSGHVWCWGDNYEGQTGSAASGGSTIPMRVFVQWGP